MIQFIEITDSEATLEEALAIIDSFHLEDVTSCYSPGLEIHGGDHTRNHTVAKKKKRRKRSNLSSSTRLQQKKKAEILYLRRRIQEMEEYIEQVYTQHLRSECSTDIGTSWKIVANANYQARLQSEETNRDLKAIMATQVQVSDTLRELVQMQASIQEKRYSVHRYIGTVTAMQIDATLETYYY